MCRPVSSVILLTVDLVVAGGIAGFAAGGAFCCRNRNRDALDAVG
jgi:hypothetical protein